MSIGMMNLAPLFCTIRASKGSLLLLMWGLFPAVPVTSMVLLISSFSGFDLPVIPFSWWPLATRLQKSSSGFGSLYAYIGDRKQISHHFGLLHDYLFHSFDIADAIMEGVNDLDVLDVRDAISSIAEMLDIIVEALITLLLDGLEGLDSRWTLIGVQKFLMNMAHSWSQEWMDPSSKLMSHDLAIPDNAACRKLVFTWSSPPAASMMIW
jgi:hypothetical protein